MAARKKRPGPLNGRTDRERWLMELADQLQALGASGKLTVTPKDLTLFQVCGALLVTQYNENLELQRKVDAHERRQD